MQNFRCVAVFAFLAAVNGAVQVPCSTEGAKLQLNSGGVLDLYPLGATTVDGDEYVVGCPDGLVAKGGTCDKCRIPLMVSFTKHGVTGVIANNDTDIAPTKDDIVDRTKGATSMMTINYLTHQVQAVNDRAYFDADLEIELGLGSPTTGQVNSGLKLNVENAWKSGSSGSLSVDASRLGDAAEMAFVLNIKSLDFGDSTMSAGMSFAIGDVTLDGAVASQGQPPVVDYGTTASGVASYDMVRNICPIMVTGNQLSINLVAPHANAAVQSTSSFLTGGSADFSKTNYPGGARDEFPKGLSMTWSAVEKDNVLFGADTASAVNAGTMGDVTAKLLEIAVGDESFDAAAPCLDIIHGGLRNFKKTDFGRDLGDLVAGTCSDDSAGFDANCGAHFTGATCEAAKPEYTASTSDAARSCYATYCFFEAMSNTTGLQSVTGWGSDACGDTGYCYHSNKFWSSIYRTHCAVACAPCNIDGTRRSAKPSDAFKLAEGPDQGETFAELDAQVIAHRPASEMTAGADAGRRLLSVGSGWYTKMKSCSIVHNGGIAAGQLGNPYRSKNYWVYKDRCDAVSECSFHFNIPWCEWGADNVPWDSSNGCYNRNTADSGAYALPTHQDCTSKSHCRIGLMQFENLDDAAADATTQVLPYCQEKCKAYQGLPYQWIQWDSWSALPKTDSLNTLISATCTANGAECTYRQYGACYDDFSSYLADRKTATGETMHGLSAIGSDASLDKARALGLVCPDENAHLCGAFSLAEHNATASGTELVCENLFALNPLSVGGPQETPLHAYDFSADADARNARMEQFPCLAFEQCGFSLEKGCYTKGDSCTAIKEDEWSCGSDAECKSAAKLHCERKDNYRGMVRALASAKQAISASSAVTPSQETLLATIYARLDDVMSDMDILDRSVYGNVNAVNKQLINLDTASSVYEQCVESVDMVKFGSEQDADVLSEATKLRKQQQCRAKVVDYMKMKSATSMIVDEDLSVLMQDKFEAFSVDGIARDGTLTLSFCARQSDLAKGKFTFSDQGSPEQGSCPAGSSVYMLYSSLDDLLRRLMDPATDAKANTLATVYGSAQANTTAGTFCNQAAELLNDESSGLQNAVASVLHCPAGTGSGLTAVANEIRTTSVKFIAAQSAATADSRRSADASAVVQSQQCPTGSFYNGTWAGPRCYNAFVTGKYFEEGHQLAVDNSDCAPEEISGVTTSPCPNGLRVTDCNTVPTDQIYYRISPNALNAYPGKCVPLISTSGQTTVQASTVDAQDVFTILDEVKTLVADQANSSVCLDSNDAQGKAAVKTLYQSLGYCSRL